jgi:hypothetical protein
MDVVEVHVLEDVERQPVRQVADWYVPHFAGITVQEPAGFPALLYVAMRIVQIPVLLRVNRSADIIAQEMRAGQTVQTTVQRTVMIRVLMDVVLHVMIPREPEPTPEVPLPE